MSRYYFVDEAGDLSLFDKRGVNIVGRNGVSKFFMLGAVRIDDPESAYIKVEDLRKELLSRSDLKKIPSMHPSNGKTARQFHAKDDHKLVRERVFNLLCHLKKQLNIKALATIHDKSKLASRAEALYSFSGEHIGDTEIYDHLVECLFDNQLHKEDCRIIFSHRGSSDRANSLRQALIKVRDKYARKQGIESSTQIDVISAYPSEYVGLQIADYYLWSLQRLYERQEDWAFKKLSDSYRLIKDLDDTRNKPYGEWYSSGKRGLTLEKLQKRL